MNDAVARLRPGLLGVLIVLAGAGNASAQQPVSSLDQLDALRNTNSRVIVSDAAGREFRGTVAGATSAALSLLMGKNTRQFPAAEIRLVRVRREDSLLNGALIGAAVGGGAALAYFLDNECRDDPACYVAVGVNAGVGALAGLGIDALIHRNVVVYAPSTSGPPYRLVLAPLAGRGRTGVRLTIGF